MVCVVIAGSCVISQDVLRKILTGLKADLQICSDSQEVVVSSDSKSYAFPQYEFGLGYVEKREEVELAILSPDVLKFLFGASKCKFQKNNGNISFSADRIQVLDSFHMIEYNMRDSSDEECYSIDSAILPILKVFFSEIAYVSRVLIEGSDWLRFSCKESELIVPVLDKRFVQMDKAKNQILSVDAVELHHVLKSVSPIATNNAKTMNRPTPVKVEFEDGKMLLTVSNNNFSGKTSKYTQQVFLSCDGVVEPFFINLTYLKDVVGLADIGKMNFVITEDHFLGVYSDKLRAKIGLLTK